MSEEFKTMAHAIANYDLEEKIGKPDLTPWGVESNSNVAHYLSDLQKEKMANKIVILGESIETWKMLKQTRQGKINVNNAFPLVDTPLLLESLMIAYEEFYKRLGGTHSERLQYTKKEAMDIRRRVLEDLL